MKKELIGSIILIKMLYYYKMKCFSKIIDCFKKFLNIKDKTEINEVLINDTYDIHVNESCLYIFNEDVLENNNSELDITTENLYDNI